MADIRTRNELRARAFAGGAFFRAKEMGQAGNKISIIAFEYAPKKAKFIVTNHNTEVLENIPSKLVDVQVLQQTLNWDDALGIRLTNPPTAQLYSISWQIAGDSVIKIKAEKKLNGFTFERLFSYPDKLTVKLSPKTPQNSPETEILIVPRTFEYDLVWEERKTLPGGWAKTGGYNIEDLRAKLADNPWIQMSPRGYDVNDEEGKDDTFLSMFPDTYLSGGDGLPIVNTGYDVSADKLDLEYMVHLNISEKENGFQYEKNEMYKWDKLAQKWMIYVPEAQV